MHLIQITGATKPATFPKASLTLENSSEKGSTKSKAYKRALIN